MNEPLQTKGVLINRMAGRYGVDHSRLLPTLKATAFKQDQGEVTDFQMMALLVVADQYGLNPFTREIYAFPDRNKGIVPVVSIDGWCRIINENKHFDGLEFTQAETLIDNGEHKPCPDWIDCTIYRKDREHPITIREHFDEVYRKPFKKGDRTFAGPWQTHTKRMLRHKAFIQCARVAFGFVGIYDEDEARRIIEGEAVVVDQPQSESVSRTEQVREKLAQKVQTETQPGDPPAGLPDDFLPDEYGREAKE